MKSSRPYAALSLLSLLVFLGTPASPAAEVAECGEHDGGACSVTYDCKRFLYFFVYGCEADAFDYWKD